MTQDADSDIHRFLIEAAVLLHRHGTPSHRLERVMAKLSNSLSVRGVFLYTPTALVISLADASGEHTFLRRVDAGSIDADKLIGFDQVLGQVEAGRMSVAQAAAEMRAVSEARPPFPWWLSMLCCGIGCGAVAIFFRGSVVEVVVAAALGLALSLLESVTGRAGSQRGLLEPLVGFVAAVSALAVAHWITPIDDRLVTLAALIVFIPGLPLTVGLTELAVGHLSAGTARLAGACTTLLTLIVGVAIGWRLAGIWRTLPAEPVSHVPDWWQWIAIVVAPIAFAILFRARWRQWPVIVGVAVAGFVAAHFSGDALGMEVGAFSGALVVGCGSNLYARLRDRPALVPLTPGIIVLVPGSLGYRSLAAMLERDTVQGIDLAFAMIIVGMALVGGILTANAVISPKRIL